MTVVGVLAETAVRHDHARITETLAQRAYRFLHDPVLGERSRPCASLTPGRPKSRTPPSPSAIVSSTVSHSESMLSWFCPGIDPIGVGAAGLHERTQDG